MEKIYMPNAVLEKSQVREDFEHICIYYHLNSFLSPKLKNLMTVKNVIINEKDIKY